MNRDNNRPEQPACEPCRVFNRFCLSTAGYISFGIAHGLACVGFLAVGGLMVVTETFNWVGMATLLAAGIGVDFTAAILHENRRRSGDPDYQPTNSGPTPARIRGRIFEQ